MIGLSHKRGDTFDLIVTVTEDGAAAEISGWAIRSQIRRGGVLAHEFTVSQIGGGQFRVFASAAEMAAVASNRYQMDIEFTDAAGHVFSTQTFDLRLVEDVTGD